MSTRAQRGDNKWQTNRHLPALAWSLFVAVLLLLPAGSLPDAGRWDWLDKPVHTVLFAVHTALLARSCRQLVPGGEELVAAALASAGFAALMELGQRLVPGRSADVWDMGANLAGIALAVLAVALWRARVRVSC